jgi:outer membrane murein-binding lipoprotein Lpp
MNDFRMPKGAIERERIKSILSELSTLASRVEVLEAKVARFEAAVAARKGKTETVKVEE